MPAPSKTKTKVSKNNVAALESQQIDSHDSLQVQAVGPIAGYEVAAGDTHPLGAIPDAGGVNFSIFSERATAVQLLLFDEHDDPEPIQVIDLDVNINKTFHFWHVYVKDLKPGMHYAY